MTGGEHQRRTAAGAQAAHAGRHAHAHQSRGHAPRLSVQLVLRRLWQQTRRLGAKLVGRRWVRRTFWGASAVLVLLIVGVLGLWWRLAHGPIELDVATPWLKSAIEQNFGSTHTVSVGGTQIERDEQGRTSLRLRDIVVRDADSTIVASAPKAEVGLSGLDLLRGQVRAQSLNLVGAEMAVRIESDGRVIVFAGADKRPIATASPPAAAPVKAPEAVVPQGALRTGVGDLAGVLTWIDGLGATGLDGHDLRELGLKDGNLIVDDRRTGKRWTFDHIDASLQRPVQGGVIFRLESGNPQRPWALSAAMRPLADGTRALGIEARQVSIRDILLALRVKDEIDADMPLSASIRAEVTADGTPQMLQGQLVVGPGVIADHAPVNPVNLPIERADFRFNWDARRHTLIVPFQVQAGGNQFTLRATLEPPRDDGGVWQLAIGRGDAVIDPIILTASKQAGDEGISLNNVNIRARIDTQRQRFNLDQGDVGRIDTRPTQNVGLAVTGSIDYASADPHVAFGVACTRMSTAVMTRLWPPFIAAHLRSWIQEHVSAGTVERIVIAGNAPFSNFQTSGPPTPDEALSVEMDTSATTLRPVPDLPAIRDADLTVRITGRTATVNLGRGTVEVAPGRRLNIASGLFRIADTHRKPQMAHTQFRIDGGVPAAAMLLASDALRTDAGLLIDPESSRGTIAAQVALDMPLGHERAPGAVRYVINADLASFAADKLLMGQRLEAAALQAMASNDGYQVKGDVKINGTPASITLTRVKTEPDAALQLQANLDDAGRKRLGINLGPAVTGSVPVTLAGRVGGDAKEERFALDADLTPVAIEGLLPGWEKPAGAPARLAATVVKGPKSVRFDDLTVTGAGANVKGMVEVDNSGELTAANFPQFALSDGDKLSLKADRTNDGALRVTMRGDVYDGRGIVKTALAGHSADKSKPKQADLDLDIRIGAVAGNYGETLRGLDLKLSRRNGRIRAFTLAAKIGRDTPLIGDLRLRARDQHQVIYIETNDAGALFRFTDLYPRMIGGRMWVAMDPPTQERTPQIGHLYVSNFVVRGDPTLARVVSNAPGQVQGGVEFTEMRCDFVRSPGGMTVSDGVVRGPLVGATIEGNIDYARNEMRMNGTFVPFYGVNNIFGQIPIVGLVLGGGSNEGLLGIAYEAVGPTSAPRINLNIATAIAPGVLRKFIPSPGAFDPNALQPAR